MNKTIKNFFNLSLLQFITMIVQLMVYPYLIEHIGTEIYGEIIFQQLILFHLQMVVIFGTDLTAVRRVSKNIRSKAKLSILFSTITIGRVYIATAISIVYALYVFYSGSSYYYLYFCFLLFESAFTTKWYFHGRQELSKFTIPFSIFKFSGVFLIFFFVHTSSELYPI
ncbi:oligosaccharide flippase family protein [Hafnia paralvei]|uniref:oligosaccharide flippase family protein n=1 Tax=Hafnia paralvei TaxID=546367 RepID=UPI0036F20A2F